MIAASGQWEGVAPQARKNFFAPADPRVAKALTEAAQ
jgi:hypothetical protein